MAVPSLSCRLVVAHRGLGLRAICGLALLTDVEAWSERLHLAIPRHVTAALLVDEPEFLSFPDGTGHGHVEPAAVQLIALVHDLAAGLGLSTMIVIERLLAARRWDRLWGGHLHGGAPFVRGGVRQAFLRGPSPRRAMELRRRHAVCVHPHWRFECRDRTNADPPVGPAA